MQTKYEDKYCLAYFDQDEAFFEEYWYKETGNLNDESFKEVITNVSTLIDGQEYESIKSLLDNRDFMFSISPELQEWHAEFITTKTLACITKPELNKTAIVVSSDFITQLSIEQTLDENDDINNNYGITRYFTDIEEARSWLME